MTEDNSNSISKLTHDIVNVVLQHFRADVERVIDFKLTQALENFNTLQSVSEQMEEKMRQMAQAAVATHEHDVTHLDTEDVVETLDNALSGRRIKDAVEEVLDDYDLSDMVRDEVRKLDFSVEVS